MPTGVLLKVSAAAFLLAVLSSPCQADPPNLGFSIDVKGDGVLNPVVTKISVTKVEKGSLAEAAGMISGDEILQIEGQPVAGRYCGDLPFFMNFHAGETRVLRLAHADGTQFDARLTKPKD